MPKPSLTDAVESLLIDRRELAAMLSVSPATVDRMSDKGRLPEPIRLSSQTLRWRRAEVLAWIDAGCQTRITVDRAGSSEPQQTPERQTPQRQTVALS